MAINDSLGYIIVNNSGKIEVINTTTLKSISTITGLNSPRNIAIINSNKAYVSSIYSNSVAILDLVKNSISGYINLRRSSESILISGSKAYISNWMGGKEVMVINTVSNKVIDSIEVAIEPESMVIDKNNTLWVLCNGGWQRNNFAELVGINTGTDIIEKRFVFSTKTASPTSLQIDGKGETLYYLDNGVQQMNIDATSLPSEPYITQTTHYFYKLGINPVNGDIFVSDAVDYQQKGYVLIYNNEGILVSTLKADISPAFMYFKLNK
jgi:YVTN family beta-propeller protein